jgi:hypothetical protein
LFKSGVAKTDSPNMGELTLTPWRRYGHDRVYVTSGETKLGYLDRANGSLVLSDEALRADVVEALTGAGYLERPEPAPEPPAVPAPEPWAITLAGDTATYKAGAGARTIAREERAAAPVRTALARILNVHTDERAWRRGAEGEEEVARRLRRLPDDWLALHDLPIGDRGANVDHLVIGPGGVFTLNTKNLSGKVWVGGETFLVNGHRTDYVRKSRWESQRVARALSARLPNVHVHGVVVVMTPELVVRSQPRDVSVVGRLRIEKWLRHRPPALAPADVAAIQRVARDPRTWR